MTGVRTDNDTRDALAMTNRKTGDEKTAVSYRHHLGKLLFSGGVFLWARSLTAGLLGRK